MENKQPKLDKAVKVSIIIGIILVAAALFYYFLIRPKQAEQAYINCLNALKDTGKFNDNTINTPYGKSSLDVCTKSKGAEKIRAEKEAADRQAELEKQQKDQKIKDLKEKIEAFSQQIDLKNKQKQELENSLSEMNSFLHRPDLSEQDRAKLSQQYNDLLEQTKKAEEEYRQMMERIEKRLKEIQQ